MKEPDSAYVVILFVLLAGAVTPSAHAQFTGDSVRIVEDPDFGEIRVGTYEGTHFRIYDDHSAWFSTLPYDSAVSAYNPMIDLSWSVECSQDAMTEELSCSANRGNLLVVKRATGAVSVTVDDEKYPGTNQWIRVDANEPHRHSENASWDGKAGQAILSELVRGDTALTRHYTFPHKDELDTKVPLKGLDVVMRYIDQFLEGGGR